MYRAYVTILLLVVPIFTYFMLFLSYCSSPNSVTEVNHQRQETEARIDWGVSIDSIAIGDESSEAINKLGEPSEIHYGDFPGDFYVYNEGLYAGLTVAINNMPDREDIVIHIVVKNPYSGTTDNGIGIGSEREKVLESLGNPDLIWESADSQESSDIWQFQNCKWIINYDENKTIIRIFATNVF